MSFQDRKEISYRKWDGVKGVEEQEIEIGVDLPSRSFEKCSILIRVSSKKKI